ncbi:MAG: PAS domain S-box protein [Methanococcoides sp.]|nr:PAS domain S-box protein [Methanococcoides sp.]
MSDLSIEKGLLESEDIYKALFEGTAEGILVADIQTKEFLFANPAMCKMLGYTEEELLQMSLLDIHLKNDLKCAISEFESQARGEKTLSSSRPCLRKDGTTLYADINTTNILINGRECNVGFFTDITERKDAEEKLKWESATNKVLAELSNALVDPKETIENITKMVMDLAMDLTTSKHGFVSTIDPETGANVAHSLTEMMEVCQVSLENKRIAFPIGEVGVYPSLWGHALNTKKAFYTNSPRTHEKSVGIPKGHIVLNNFLSVPAVVRDELLGQIALANSETGYTERELDLIKRIADLYGLSMERKQMEEALRKSEASLSNAQRISHVGNCDWDIVNNELHWSDEVYHIFGLEPQESRATYNAYIRAIHPDDRMLVLEHINKAIYENKPYSIDYRILLPDGSELIVHEQAEVTFNETGQAIRMAGTVQDITVRKKAENAMFNAKLVAEAADKSKAEFIANMTHELRTPLNAVIGFSEMLMLGTFGTLNEKQTKYVNNITSSGKHLLDAINEILDLSKIEAGKMELHPEEFEVSSAIEEVNIMVASMAEKKRIAITADLADNTTVIEADKTKFKQILYNLLSNAIKFTDQGGSVTIGEKTLDDLVHISVKDSGIGISPEDQDKLFNPFFQVDSSSTREYGGTGLGLALIKKFVEMHGGEVWVESEVGKGSIFTFSIPMASKVQ